MKWYLLDWPWTKERIQPIEIEKFTDVTVTIDGRRRNRISSNQSYFPTAQEAKDHAIAEATRTWEVAKSGLDRARSALENAKRIELPCSTPSGEVKP